MFNNNKKQNKNSEFLFSISAFHAEYKYSLKIPHMIQYDLKQLRK